MSAGQRIIEGLKEAVEGRFARATFFGVDPGSKDFNGILCPGCQEPHRWRVRQPKRCRHCGLTFEFRPAPITGGER